MPTLITITCKCGCGNTKQVREADVKRGWGLFYSKSCKAKHQEKRTGQYARQQGDSNFQNAHLFDNCEQD